MTKGFVALLAVGGTYLTPDLKTDAEWVPWAQLAVAPLVHTPAHLQ